MKTGLIGLGFGMARWLIGLAGAAQARHGELAASCNA